MEGEKRGEGEGREGGEVEGKRPRQRAGAHVDERALELLLGDLASEEIGAHVRRVHVRPLADFECCARRAEDDVLDVVEARVLQRVFDKVHRVGLGARAGRAVRLHDALRWQLARAVSLHQLALHIRRRVLHEDRRVDCMARRAR